MINQQMAMNFNNKIERLKCMVRELLVPNIPMHTMATIILEIADKNPPTIPSEIPKHFISLKDFSRRCQMAYNTGAEHLKRHALENNIKYHVYTDKKISRWVCREALLAHMVKHGTSRVKSLAKRQVEYFKKVGEWDASLE